MEGLAYFYFFKKLKLFKQSSLFDLNLCLRIVKSEHLKNLLLTLKALL